MDLATQHRTRPTQSDFFDTAARVTQPEPLPKDAQDTAIDALPYRQRGPVVRVLDDVEYEEIFPAGSVIALTDLCEAIVTPDGDTTVMRQRTVTSDPYSTVNRVVKTAGRMLRFADLRPGDVLADGLHRSAFRNDGEITDVVTLPGGRVRVTVIVHQPHDGRAVQVRGPRYRTLEAHAADQRLVLKRRGTGILSSGVRLERVQEPGR